jgi:hypothetical protein
LDFKKKSHLSQIEDADKTSVYFDMLSSYTVDDNGGKSVAKKHQVMKRWG